MRARPRSNGSHDYICQGGSTEPRVCMGATMSAPKLDKLVWNKAYEILTNPDIIRQEIERQRDQDPTIDDLAANERMLSQVDKQQKMTAHAVAMLDNEDAAEPLIARLEQLAERKRGLVEERERIERNRQAWQQAQANLDSIEEWCATVTFNLEAMTYEQRRLALDVLGFRAAIYRKDHSPRYVITAEIDSQVLSRSS